ncbi:sodium-coupled monocarboxylate transporter 1-like, partial [Tribolium madens]
MSGFFWYDYLIFFIVLAISSGTGIYYGCFGSKQKTVKEYLLGGKKMTPLPIAISVAVSHFSAITIMGVPTEVYKFGAYFVYTMISFVLLGITSISVFFPVFFKLQVTSIYEYLEKRFDNKTKVLVSFFFIVSEVSNMAIGTYAPSLALSAVTGFRLYYIIICVFGTCIFYTTIGGLKTV